MLDFELGDVAEQRNFWIVVVGFLFASGLFQLYFGNLMLAVTAFGSSTVFTVIAREKLKEES